MKKKQVLYNGKLTDLLSLLKEYNISKASYYRALSKFKNEEEAINYCIKHKRKKIQTPAGKGIYQIAKEENISPVSLYNHIKKGKTLEEAILSVKQNKGKHNVTIGKYEIDEKSIHPYCIEKGYNYDVIYHKIKANGLSAQDALDEYLKLGQTNKIKYYRHQVHGVLLKHFLLSYQLNYSDVGKLLKENKSTLEIIKYKVFSKRINNDHKSGKYYLNLLGLLEICSEEEKEQLINLFDINNDTLEILKYKKELFEKIKKDLFYLEFCQLLSICNEEEKIQAIKTFGITNAEMSYIKNELYVKFNLVESYNKDSIYVKKPYSLLTKSKEMI